MQIWIMGEQSLLKQASATLYLILVVMLLSYLIIFHVHIIFNDGIHINGFWEHSARCWGFSGNTNVMTVIDSCLDSIGSRE